jgi:hypothetical protein
MIVRTVVFTQSDAPMHSAGCALLLPSQRPVDASSIARGVPIVVV